MNKLLLIIALVMLVLIVSSDIAKSQIKISKKSWLTAYGRSLIVNDNIMLLEETDTLTAKRSTSGNTLVDLTANIQPNENIYINATARIRNDFGGFWGSGVSFDLRSLYLRALVAKAIRIQLGDIDYKLTPYTFYNNEDEIDNYLPRIFNLQKDPLRQDLFYKDENTWRQQGLSLDFGLSFKKYIKEVNVDAFLLRLQPGLNGNLEKLIGGAHLDLIQSKYVDAQINYVNTFEIEGTGSSTDRFSNPVISGGIGIHYPLEQWSFDIDSEFGSSNQKIKVNADSISKEDYFMEAGFSVSHKKSNLKVRLGYQEVGPGFRSVAAQTKRLNFNGQGRAFTRIGNNQAIRSIGSIDFMRDAALYNLELKDELMSYNPALNNFAPYGLATPNRRNIRLGLNWNDHKERIELAAEGIYGNELLGQGTEALKQFSVIDFKSKINIDKFLTSINKPINIQFAYRFGKTNRSGDSPFEEIDLTNQQFGFGINAIVWEDFELLAGYHFVDAKGNEYLRRTNSIQEVVSFDLVEFDLKQTMLALGGGYNFSEKIFLHLYWNQYKHLDENNKIGNHRINSWNLLFNMKL